MTTSTTGRALLGLLSIRSWTAYELTRQMRRALRWAWPRSEANLYSEVKRLVPLGLAEAVEEEGAGRTRTRYAVTDAGRGEVATWLHSHPPAPPQLEFEALLRVFLADRAPASELTATIAETRQQLVEQVEEAVVILEEYASAPPYPERAHLNVLFIHFYAGHIRHMLEWCDEVEAEMATWSGRTADVGFTPRTRQMLDDALAYYRSVLTEHGRAGS